MSGPLKYLRILLVHEPLFFLDESNGVSFRPLAPMAHSLGSWVLSLSGSRSGLVGSLVLDSTTFLPSGLRL